MKKTLLVGLALCGLLNISFLTISASACLGPDGKPVEGTDGEVTNCATVVEEPEPFEVSTEAIDFGYFSEVGRSYTQTFVLSNNTGEAVAVKVSPTKPETAGLSDDNKLGADWIVIVGGVKFFEIPAHSTKTVGLRVMVPADAKPGSQYAKIIIDNTTAKETHEIDVRMTVATEGLAFGGEVVKSEAAPVSLDEKLRASMTVKNGGNAGFEAEYSVRVKSKFASNTEEWKEAYKTSATVYPGSEHKFEVPSDEVKKLGYGLFTIEQKVVYINSKGEKIEEVSTRTVLNLPVWALCVAGGVIVLAIVVTIIVKVVRKKKYGDDEEDWDEEEEEEEKPGKAKKAAKKSTKKEKKAKAKKEKKVDIEIDQEDIED